jgi:hypothetical protein
VVELTSDEDTLRNHLTQHFSSLVAKHDGWQTLKAKGDSYDQHFAWKADNIEFVLDALTKYRRGKEMVNRKGQFDTCTWHSHLDTPTCPSKEQFRTKPTAIMPISP